MSVPFLRKVPSLKLGNMIVTDIESELFSLYCSIDETIKELETIWPGSVSYLKLKKHQRTALCTRLLHNYIKHHHADLADQLEGGDLGKFIRKMAQATSERYVEVASNKSTRKRRP